MCPAEVKSECLPANHADQPMLVLGYRGTLEPEPGWPDFGEAPPQMEALIEPMLADAVRELERQIPEGQRIFSGERIPVEGLLEGLWQRLAEILTLTVAACLPEGDAGANLTERDLARSFPGLAWLLRLAVCEWVTAAVTFCERLGRDGARLAEWIGVESLPPVESVSATAADTHPGGHVVLRVVFRGGRCLYYKPRAVTGEWLWQKLLESIAECEPALRLPAGRVLERSVPGRYGWMESVRPGDSTWSEAEGCEIGPAYWHAAGAMLCLAYHAALTDLHLGNVIATPRGPAVTDAECLGTPNRLSSSIWGDGGDAGDSSQFLKSLVETGLLPSRVADDVPDTSGLFGCGGPVPKLGLPKWAQGADGRYRLTPVRAFLRDHGNAPDVAQPLAVMPELLAGYRAAASALLRARRMLVAPGSRWRRVLEHEHAPRIVVRDTLTYGLLLSRSLDPSQLGADSTRRRTLLCELQLNGFDGSQRSVLREELHALLRLHVPRLILLPGTRTLASHSGRALARGFARRTPGAEVAERIEELSLEQVERVQVPALLLAMLRT